MSVVRFVGAACASAVIVGMSALPAMAEGSWTSSISGWLPGEETRDWTDKNRDDVSTRLSNKQCSATPGSTVKNLGWELNRNDTATPDEHYGIKWLTCNSSTTMGTGSWGDRGKGNFDFTLRGVNKSKDDSPVGHVSAKSVKVSY